MENHYPLQTLRKKSLSKVYFSLRKKPLKKVISKLVIACAILAVGLISGTSYGLVRSIILTSSQENALKEAQKASLEIDQWLTELRSQAESIANNSNVRSMNWSQAEPFLQLELDRLPNYYMLSLVNVDGSYYTTKAGFVEGQNLRDRLHFQKALAGETTVSQPIISRSTGVYQISVCSPIWSISPLNRQSLSAEQTSIRTQSLQSLNLPDNSLQKNTVRGVLCASVSIGKISRIVEKISNIPQYSYAFVLDKDGIPIVHPDPQILQERKSFLANSNSSKATLAQKMVNSQEGIELIYLNNSWVYIAYNPTQQANWSIGLVIPQDRLEVQLRPLNLLATVIGILLTLATIFAIWQVQLFEETREQAARETLVNQLTEQIRASLDLNTLLQITVQEVMRVLGLSWVGFSWYQTEQKHLEIVCSSSQLKFSRNFPQINTFIEKNFTNFLVSSPIASAEMISWDQLEKTQLSDANKTDLKKAGISCYFALQIQVNSNQKGYLIGLSSAPISNEKAILKLLKTIRGQLIIAITQANLYKQVKEKVELLNQTLDERLEAQAQLQQKMEMLDRSSNGIIIRDMGHKITYWNQGAENIYGWKKAEVMDKNIHSLLTTIFPTSQAEVMEQLLQEGTWTGELQHQTKDFQNIVAFSRWTLQRDEQGNPYAILEINSDITERKAAEIALAYSETKLREKATQLEATLVELQRTQAQVIQNEKMSSLGQLVAGVAHEINNPVNFIYGNLTHAEEYMQDLVNLLHLYQDNYPDSTPEIQDEIEVVDLEFIEEDFPKILKSMKNGAKRIEDIVVSLRNFSRMDEADLKEVNIHEGIDSTLMILQSRLNLMGSQTQIEVIKNYGNLPLVECYPGRLNQVLMNLLINAIDAIQEKYNQPSLSAAQGTVPTIEISTELLENNQVQIRIKDNGYGVSESAQDHLFDPFFTTKPVGKGTGLGLSIGYQIITEKHQGNLYCNCKLEAGAEFIIEIPRKQG
ncbi:MAG: ATP-binding protein [Limnoraphis sp.]